MLSIIISLLYISFLNLVVMYGAAMLIPGASFLLILFRKPIIIATAGLMLLLNRWVMAPFKNIKKEKKKPIGYWALLMYTGVAVIIYLYTRYSNALFQ